MSCPYQCFLIGGPWIAENPSCPEHGAEGRALASTGITYLGAACDEALRKLDEAVIHIESSAEALEATCVDGFEDEIEGSRAFAGEVRAFVDATRAKLTELKEKI